MAHLEQKNFFLSVKNKYPEAFKNVEVVDFGSKDYNGSLKELFTDSNYIGIDISEGTNVDVISEAHLYNPMKEFDTVVSGEMLEHDEYWKESLQNMYRLLKSGGLMVISCAGKDRPEHGTRRTDGQKYGTTSDYYMNLEPEHIESVLSKDMFTDYYCVDSNKDTYFYGVKK